MKRYLTILFIMLMVYECRTQAWLPVGTGIKSQKINAYNNIYSLTVYKDELYAGGSFTEVGGIITNFIAKWDGIKWSAVGMGMNGIINALCVYRNELYAAGWFTLLMV